MPEIRYALFCLYNNAKLSMWLELSILAISNNHDTFGSLATMKIFQSIMIVQNDRFSSVKN